MKTSRKIRKKCLVVTTQVSLDIVAYKVMELSADYTPGVSAYKEGKVLAVEGETLSIELVAGIIRRSGRFELGEEEVVEKNVEHNMRDLIEPVLVKQA